MKKTAKQGDRPTLAGLAAHVEFIEQELSALKIANPGGASPFDKAILTKLGEIDTEVGKQGNYAALLHRRIFDLERPKDSDGQIEWAHSPREAGAQQERRRIVLIVDELIVASRAYGGFYLFEELRRRILKQ